ncbi:MAG: helix-turn-helix transcriptional regulator [Kiritimatiellae bacterium]|jgi:ribosome-binding protein aMBF1 (putative translation factor)|nr:helix-turn-helix transcriptional regulator [Kiritimatiellia bacterium]
MKTHPGYSLVVEGREQAVVREPSAVYNPVDGAGKAVSEFAGMFGKRLERARRMRGYSLRGLSDALPDDISHTQLQKIERGLVSTDTYFLAKVSHLLDSRPDFFMRP